MAGDFGVIVGGIVKRPLVKIVFFGWLFAFSVLQAKPLRIIAIGGPITEIVCALGAEKDLIGVDSSSTYPACVTKLPQVGYQRSLSSEGILSLRPTLVLASEEAGPPRVVGQLRNSGIPWKTIPVENSVEGVKAKIRAVARALDLEAQGEALVRRLEGDVKKVLAKRVLRATTKKVIFIFAHGGGSLLAAGQGTAADAMITLAGGANAISGYIGYKPLTAEAVLLTSPDIILISKQGLESVRGIEGLLSQPGLAQTPAGKSRHIVTMDDLLLLGFGPRLGEVLQQLMSVL